MPSAAMRSGSICTRTAGFCWPLTLTRPTPPICEICWASTFSTTSSISVSGITSDCAAMIMIGESAGLILRIDGGLGSVDGSWPPDALMAD